MKRNELIRQVALRMDEVTPDSPDFTIADIPVDGSDNNPLYALIDGLVDSGALELFSVAPYWRLPQKEFDPDTDIVIQSVGTPREYMDGSSKTIGARKVIRLKVPDDFLRVAEIDCEEFQRPITEAVPEISEMGKRQHNPFLMGKEARPVGVISHGKWEVEQDEFVQCREIDCYSLPSSSTLDETDMNATYIPTPEMPAITDTTTDIETVVPPVLVDALEWIIAARTFGARGDANHAAICQQNAQNLLV